MPSPTIGTGNMDSKKMYPSSLLEDDLNWVGPSPTPAPRSVSPLSSGGRRPGTALATSSQQFVDDHSLSCVTRETAHEDCARHRFIVWAAVKRNSSKRMLTEDRLRCPLIKCAQPFQDHESMLRHLAGCKHLASGQYWCYDHMRAEHFDDVKCKRCLGHPSKRRKMLSMAKNFFHALGHKSKKNHTYSYGLDVDNVSLMPPPYDSLGITPVNGDTPSELPSTDRELPIEIDSVEVSSTSASTSVPASTAAQGVIDPQALLVPILPCLPELDSTGLPNDSFMQWQPTSSLPEVLYATDGIEDGGSRHAVPKPSLQVNTYGLQGRRHAPRPVPRPEPPRSKGLSPSSSVRSTASTDTNASTASNVTTASGVSSMISPASNWSGVWSMASGINTSLTTPIEGLLADDAFAEAINNYEEHCPDYLHDFFSELPADLPASFSAHKITDTMAIDPIVSLAVPAPVNFPYDADIVLTEDSVELVDINEPEVEQSNACCSEVKSMVESSWDALQEHIVSSMVKIQDVTDNPVAGQLRSMSTRTIATTGLQTLRTLLSGGQPSSAADTLCFIHLIYAFSLVVHEQGASHRVKELFLQSLSYTNSLPPNDRDFFTQLVYAVWQPPDITQVNIRNYFAMGPNGSLSRSSSLKGKSPQIAGHEFGSKEVDSLLVAARNFLDELESSLVLGPTPDSVDIQTSKLFSKHLQDNPSSSVHQAFAITVTYVSSQLIDGFSDARGLKNNVNRIIQRVKTGEICSVRRVEIELLHAGKGCVSPRRFFDDFVPQVREMCDPIYQQHDAGTSRRNDYHCLGVTLIETIMPEFDSSPTGNSVDHMLEDDLDDNFDEYFNKLSPDCVAETTMSFAGIGTEFDHLLGATSQGHLAEFASGLQVPLLITTPPESGTSSGQSPMSSLATSDDNQRQTSHSSEPTIEQSNSQKIEANSSCEICGYRPKGDPQWFKGSMAKHKKLQHSTAPPKIYKCPYPGCSSQYKNRPDNLRQHQIEKGHWVQGEEGTQRRPSKRKKLETEPDEE